MSEQEKKSPDVVLEGGTYEIIRNRLNDQGKELRRRINILNENRKAVFGSTEMALTGSDRITTNNNCVPRDMVALNDDILFGYNVQMGLKSVTNIEDVFGVYQFDHETDTFKTQAINLIDDKRFKEDFAGLYKYYKKTTFVKFVRSGPYLYMVFRIGKSASDIKTFKWVLQEDSLGYVDNRSEHEIIYPPQHEFEWKRATRDMQRTGKHPHVSIHDRVFVETVGGDLTIKVEDNTDSGRGIYEEDVDHADQTLDDAEIYFSIVGHLILLKIRPYQENDWRYFIFNEKLQTVNRVDDLADSCVLLPDDHGLIYSKGYYLAAGENQSFDLSFENMLFEKRIVSPNGEDHLFVFYNRMQGEYVLMPYNVIEQKVSTPMPCQGYSIFANGEMMVFSADEEPRKHHLVQHWKTPYFSPDHVQEAKTDSYLFKIGNKDIVRAMAECTEILKLVEKQETYSALYLDLSKRAADISSSYHWLNRDEAGALGATLLDVKATATSAIDEYEKVIRIRRETATQIADVTERTEKLIKSVRRRKMEQIDQFVSALSEMRGLRGEIIGLKDLRYTDLPQIEALEAQVVEQADNLSKGCISFLLEDEALAPYIQKIADHQAGLSKITKVTEAAELGDVMNTTAGELDLLIEIVSTLKIDDATHTTQIIDSISTIYADLNAARASLTTKKRELGESEGLAEFNAQIKLISQSVINFLDISDTPERCDEYLTKLMVQLGDLEGKFAEYDAFIDELTEKRESIYSAFEAKKLSLTEARNRRTTALHKSAGRILKGIKNKLAQFESVEEIHGYFASDLMVDKVRNIAAQLIDLEDTVKADDIQSQLKTIREESARQLKDRQELFVDGENIIKFGEHKFSVNTQDLDLTIVRQDDEMLFHLTGTNFYQTIDDPTLVEMKEVWLQNVISESKTVYRGEYLAFHLLNSLTEPQINGFRTAEESLKLQIIQQFMGPRYHEGYVKGVHDRDTLKLLDQLVDLRATVGLLRFDPVTRGVAAIWWLAFADSAYKKQLSRRLDGLETLRKVFKNGVDYSDIIDEIQDQINTFATDTNLFNLDDIQQAGEYLFEEFTNGINGFECSAESSKAAKDFGKYLRTKKQESAWIKSLTALKGDPAGAVTLIRYSLDAWFGETKPALDRSYLVEAMADLVAGNVGGNKDNFRPAGKIKLDRTVKELAGDHPLIKKGEYHLNYGQFISKLTRFEDHQVPRFTEFEARKKSLVVEFKAALRLGEFKPRVLSSFVRNKLIDEVYLPIIGDNLAKQIGSAGENKRTDNQGLLMLISPPGYGKTTLMEYIASRVGLIFMKINGPALGHDVHAIDPETAPNASAREELQKLNLAFEMGDNVMIYLDDIQHCHPEFLQKFISLCDAQRRIEGVWNGKSKTYDFRGRKVAVVMAGNPYTESGDKFQIPDMLSNRADTYNLGDILGSTRDAFEMSYLENCMSSNSTLNTLAIQSRKDVHAIIRLAETGEREGMNLEGNYSPEALNDMVSVLQKLLKVRDVVLKVNQMYIQSAAQADEYRTEPAFKLQGSYRNMGRMAEKIMPIMNEEELQTLIMSSYENEAQTLTSSAEANLLKFKMMMDWMQDGDQARWDEICKTFRKNNALMGMGGDRMAQILSQLAAFSEGLEGIKDALEGGKG